MRKISFCTSSNGDVDELATTYPMSLRAGIEADVDVEFVLVNQCGSETLDNWVASVLQAHIKCGLVRYHRSSRPRGAAESENIAFHVSTGHILSRLPAGHVLTPGYIREVRKLIGDVSDRRIVVSPRDALDGTEGRISLYRVHFEQLGGYDEQLTHVNSLHHDLIRRAFAYGLFPHTWSAHHGICVISDEMPQTALARPLIANGVKMDAEQTQSILNLASGRLIANPGRKMDMNEMDCADTEWCLQRSATTTTQPPVPSTESRLTFGATIHRESIEQIEWMLAGIRASHPHASIFVVADGVDRRDCLPAFRRYGVSYSEGSYLKAPETGGLWWQRFFDLAMQHPFDYLFKVDADTRIRRTFRSFPDVDIFGTWTADHIQGGIQGFTRHAAERIYGSRTGEDPIFRDTNTWAKTPAAKWHLAHYRQSSSDFVLMAIARHLDLTVEDWADVDSMFRQTRDFRQDALATHPHKFQATPKGWRLAAQGAVHSLRSETVRGNTTKRRAASLSTHRVAQLSGRLSCGGTWTVVTDQATAQIDAQQLFPADSFSRTEYLAEEPVDVVFLNGLKDRSQIVEMIERCWPRLREGGILCGSPYYQGTIGGTAFDTKSVVDEMARLRGWLVRLTLDAPPVWYVIRGDSAEQSHRLKIGIVTASDYRQRDLFDLSAPNKIAYAKRYGYGFIANPAVPSADIPSHWQRLPLLKQHLRRFDWLFWTDVDSYFMNADIPIHSFISDQDEDANLVISVEDMGVGSFHVNSGQFAIRNSEWSERFLDEWYSLRHRFVDDPLQDQRALIHLIESRDLSKRIRLIPQWVCNSYPSNYRPGDFIQHFAGLAPDEKRRLMQLYAPFIFGSEKVGQRRVSN